MGKPGKFNGILCKMGILAAMAIFVLSGCATQKFVGEQIAPVSDRVTQAENRIDQADSQIAKLGDRATADEAKITKIEGDLGKVDAKAEQALARFENLRFQRRMIVDMRDGANFDFDSATLSDEAKQTIDAFIGNLGGGQSPVFLIAGHTDDRGSEDLNYELGKRRAEAVSRYLITEKNIDPLRVVTASYGETSPVAGNDTREGRAKNRRVEILVYSEGITQ